MKLVVVAGARPNFMKVAPIMWEIARRPGFEAYLVHTGQHYDQKMSRLFLTRLSIPKPTSIWASGPVARGPLLKS